MNLDPFAKAVDLDIQEQYILAADAYEKTLIVVNPPLDAFINLACLYWDATDFGVNAYWKLSYEFVSKSGDRMFSVLDEAKLQFRNLPELEFWKRYFEFTTLSEDDFLERAIELIAMPHCSLVPYFFVFSQTQDEKYKLPAKILYEQSLLSLTAKNRYIVSVLKAFF